MGRRIVSAQTDALSKPPWWVVTKRIWVQSAHAVAPNIGALVVPASFTLIALIVYLPTLIADQFIRDDFDWLQLTQAPQNIQVLAEPLWGVIWRPTVALYFAILQFFFENSFAYNCVSVGFLAATCFLLYHLVQVLVEDKKMAMLASMLFLTRANIAEAVIWPSAIGVVFAGFFGLVTVAAYLHFLESGKLLVYLSALLTGIITLVSKEEAIVLPVLMCLAILLARKRLQIWTVAATLPYWVLAIFIATWRVSLAWGSGFLKRMELVTEPVGFILSLVRGFTHSIIPVEPNLFFSPNVLVPSWLLQLRSVGLLSVIVIFALLLVLGVYIWFNSRIADASVIRQMLILAGMITITTIIPFIFLGSSISGRYSYLPSVVTTFLHGIWFRFFGRSIRHGVLVSIICSIILINVVHSYLLQFQIFGWRAWW